MRKRTLVLLGATGAMALGIAAPVAAAAATNDPTPRQQQFASELAKELGVDESKVNAALDKMWAERTADQDQTQRQDLKTRLDQAVKDGKLTQAEADAILKAAESGVLWGGWNGEWKGNWNGWHGHWDRSTTDSK